MVHTSYLTSCQTTLKNDIRKSNHTPVFCPISGDCDKLGIPNLARMSLMKCYLMLKNARVTAFIFSELLSENQQGE